MLLYITPCNILRNTFGAALIVTRSIHVGSDHFLPSCLAPTWVSLRRSWESDQTEGFTGEAGCGNRQIANTPYVLTSPSLPPQDGFPIRIKAVHVVNEPRIFKGIFAIIKPFLKEKIANRVSDGPTNLRYFTFVSASLFVTSTNLIVTSINLVYYLCPGTIHLEITMNNTSYEVKKNKNIIFGNRESKARIVI